MSTTPYEPEERPEDYIEQDFWDQAMEEYLKTGSPTTLDDSSNSD